MRILLDNFSKSFGSTKVIENMQLEVGDGEMLALLGPSGCGKSTTLFAVCGIHRPTSGRILFGDRDVTDLPSQARNVGVVFQSYALYPHMTVAENIAFPLKVKGVPASDIRKEVERIAALVHIDNLIERRPAQLSGGQQQRVALARALIRKPDVLLLDEPLANLDAKLRLEMRSEIRRLQRETGITAILVTHDQVEAMSMCDRIAIMKEGEIVQIATPAEMYNDPKTAFVAGFLGNPPITFLRGVVDKGAFRIPESEIRVPLPDTVGAAEGTKLMLGVRPEHFTPAGDVTVSGKVTFAETQGRENLYDVALAGGPLLRSIQPVRNDIHVGDDVRWAIDSRGVFVFDENGRRL
ncbi:MULTISPECIES: ABC transporter ATP-binding protein [Rhizobium]|uniref:ABC transporter ATP-binding protein n=1 Tax=Rhizobium TaxID=379 RepID=UPI0007E9A089|nr:MULTISPECIES: ABC transporter ATP-binding protein [Rhizobium]ANM13473.1 sugar ABC transporter ATP-binding protein [Rhizobium sp. N324]ANM19869.1 sugar ABC transporter ATP-binding protein [Rhizobium sp. N541]ANM26254.1 sugar ABC transporter ATP-binding protein [Rhizobium sp. N941]OYD01263.1 sugar ABC transporter ATP-binding protein [Rhizobium sp. N4311]RFB85347.1 ABC transporter ATP-binding protein [Rhizobium leguminosarum bv. trifolii]